jgi:predicted CXXCH cytochrome family protein
VAGSQSARNVSVTERTLLANAGNEAIASRVTNEGVSGRNRGRRRTSGTRPSRPTEPQKGTQLGPPSPNAAASIAEALAAAAEPTTVDAVPVTDTSPTIPAAAPAPAPASASAPVPAAATAAATAAAAVPAAAAATVAAAAAAPRKPTRPSRAGYYIAGGATIAAAAIALAFALRRSTTHAPSAISSDAAAAAVLRPPRVDAAPRAPARAFAGSDACKQCHPDEHAKWSTDWHARALAPATSKTVVGDFSDEHFAGASTEAWMTRTTTAFVMRTKGADGALGDYRIDHVLGGKRMQDTITVLADGRWQVLPISFHTSARAWVDYTETKQGALAPDHPFFWTNPRRMANHECLDCHTTGLRVSYDASTRAWTTTYADGRVGCESCHGPGAVHADTQEAGDIIHPGKSPAVAFEACGRCHGPRQPLFPLLDADHAFELGRDRYDEYYDPIVLTLADGSASTDYFADGRPKTSSFEYQAVLQSQCYRKGEATCLACHTAPHEPHRENDLVGKKPDDVCTGCHTSIAREGNAHTRHTDATAQRCVSCHMPPVVSGVLDKLADHAIDVPAPQNTARHGIPNACGVCHTDQTADQLAASLAAWWPDAAARQARRIRLADAFAEATKADSGEPLTAVVTDASEAPTLRGAAAVVLGRRFGGQVAAVLLPLLDDPSPLLRAKACEGLGGGKITAGGDAAYARTTDPSLRVRLACALALHDMGDARGEAVLSELATAPESEHLLIPHDELGVAFARRGQWTAARRELSAVVTLAPYYAEAIVRLAGAAAEDGDLDEARARIEQALALEPANKAALALRAKLGSPPP